MRAQDATQSSPSADPQAQTHRSPADAAAAPEVRSGQVQGQADTGRYASSPRGEAEQRDVQNSRLSLLERQVSSVPLFCWCVGVL